MSKEGKKCCEVVVRGRERRGRTAASYVFGKSGALEAESATDCLLPCGETAFPCRDTSGINSRRWKEEEEWVSAGGQVIDGGREAALCLINSKGFLPVNVDGSLLAMNQVPEPTYGQLFFLRLGKTF